MALSHEGRVTLRELRKATDELQETMHAEDIDLVRVLVTIAHLSATAVGLKRDIAHSGDVGDA